MDSECSFRPAVAQTAELYLPSRLKVQRELRFHTRIRAASPEHSALSLLLKTLPRVMTTNATFSATSYPSEREGAYNLKGLGCKAYFGSDDTNLGVFSP